MSNEAVVRSSLGINKNNLHYSTPSQQAGFSADVTGQAGPTPGLIIVPVGGVVVDLSKLATPGLYEIVNTEDVGGNYFEYGVRDPVSNQFYVWGEVLPGESYIGRFSRNLQEYYAGTGTGTSAATNQVFLKATGGTVKAVLQAFEK